jgi:hypothetical protein
MQDDYYAPEVELFLRCLAMLQLNPVRTKALTNVRAASKDENVNLTPPRLVSYSLLWFC